jgi:hypothetical protein
MITTKEVSVKINKKNITHYTKLGYNINLRDIIKIIPSELISGSKIKIDVSCDRCFISRNIHYTSYYCNINRSLDKNTYMCDKCSHEKIKQTNIKKYGVEYFSQTDEFNDKIKKTSLEKFGMEHYSKTSEYIEQRTNTNIKKFGVGNPFELTDLIKSSMLSKYGVSHPSKIENIKSKRMTKRRITKELNGDWIKSEDISDWNLYKNIVRTQTSKNKKKLFDLWNGNDYYDGEYIKDNISLHHFNSNYPTIDHKISIYNGFINKIKPEEISNISNLVITKRILNIKKGKN